MKGSAALPSASRSFPVEGRVGVTEFSRVPAYNPHDGFTLNDLVSFNVKHNDANGEGNRDGSNDAWQRIQGKTNYILPLES
jgi:hypothetical protein